MVCFLPECQNCEKTGRNPPSSPDLQFCCWIYNLQPESLKTAQNVLNGQNNSAWPRTHRWRRKLTNASLSGLDFPFQPKAFRSTLKPFFNSPKPQARSKSLNTRARRPNPIKLSSELTNKDRAECFISHISLVPCLLWCNSQIHHLSTPGVITGAADIVACSAL